MKATPTSIPEVLVLEPKVFGDDRFFFESFKKAHSKPSAESQVFA
jgi:dTDP-4-dehydrorhamnose 3,5-epimerase